MKHTTLKKRRPIITLLAMMLALAFFAVPTVAVGEGIPDLRIEGDPSLICMVTDRYMGSEQLPVEVDGKTYYGCCGGCVGKIVNKKSVRTGIDPVSGAEVDKATAVIGVEKGGKVLYFESEETLNEYTKKNVAPQVE